ncbi:uncharacterized protein B0H18DRAFT_1006276, partial [Fomitopsis serialis]|uniref:uncharacterized protein n=1 Tax=Fomitopsis serialis TaxID=139415 RepID=UPI002007D3D6
MRLVLSIEVIEFEVQCRRAAYWYSDRPVGLRVLIAKINSTISLRRRPRESPVHRNCHRPRRMETRRSHPAMLLISDGIVSAFGISESTRSMRLGGLRVQALNAGDLRSVPEGIDVMCLSVSFMGTDPNLLHCRRAAQRHTIVS